MKIENASATDVEEYKSSTGTDSEAESVIPVTDIDMSDNLNPYKSNLFIL